MINNNWDNLLKEEYKKEYFKILCSFIDSEYKNKIIYPNYNNIFNALKLIDYNDINVVIIGQDPYHGENEAHGLAFSVKEGINKPPSLVNIFKELNNDLNIKKEESDLTDWAKQGVLLLNSILTVEKDYPLSHKDKGWEIFTNAIISLLGERNEPLVFILWGNYARSKKELISNKRHLIIESFHPSPLSASRGFFGSRPFSRTNSFLREEGRSEIKW